MLGSKEGESFIGRVEPVGIGELKMSTDETRLMAKREVRMTTEDDGVNNDSV